MRGLINLTRCERIVALASLASGFRPVESSSALCTSPLAGFFVGQSVLVLFRFKRSPDRYFDMFHLWSEAPK